MTLRNRKDGSQAGRKAGGRGRNRTDKCRHPGMNRKRWNKWVNTVLFRYSRRERRRRVKKDGSCAELNVRQQEAVREFYGQKNSRPKPKRENTQHSVGSEREPNSCPKQNTNLPKFLQDRGLKQDGRQQCKIHHKQPSGRIWDSEAEAWGQLWT